MTKGWQINDLNKTFSEYLLSLCSFIVSSITCLIGCVLIFQLYYSRKNTDNEFKKSQREKTVDLLITWSTERKKEYTMARRIVQSFDEESCRKLNRVESFRVTTEQYRNIYRLVYNKDWATSGDKNKENQILESGNCKENNSVSESCKSCVQVNHECCDSQKTYLVKINEIITIRSYIMDYLNLLESILVAWYYHVADRQMIEDQFEYLATADNGMDVLSKFRQAIDGNNCFPCIERFCLNIIEKKRKKLVEQEEIKG